MKIFLLAATIVVTASSVHAAEQPSLHLRIHGKGGACTITNESQCDGQNWTGSTCCADSNYECRWSDDGQNVKRCQKKRGKGQHHKATKKDSEDDGFDIDVDTDDLADALGINSGVYDDWSDYGDFSDIDDVLDWVGSDSSDSSDDYDDSGESANDDSEDSGSDDSEESGSDDSEESGDGDMKRHHQKRLAKGWCTITNESQCDGQNWTGSTCCADPNYECRWSDDGQNVKRCQKKRG